MADPRVTVIIATYNWSSVLHYSVRSVLGQSFTDFELLVVGDGCTDDSEDARIESNAGASPSAVTGHRMRAKLGPPV